MIILPLTQFIDGLVSAAGMRLNTRLEFGVSVFLHRSSASLGISGFNTVDSTEKKVWRGYSMVEYICIR